MNYLNRVAAVVAPPPAKKAAAAAAAAENGAAELPSPPQQPPSESGGGGVRRLFALAGLSSNPNATAIRALTQRVQTCALAKDRRDALAELAATPELAEFLTPDAAALLLATARRYSDDPDVLQFAVEILAIATEEPPPLVPSSLADGGTAAAKRRDAMDRRELLLRELFDVGFLVSNLAEGSFWVRYHSVKLLQRLHEVFECEERNVAESLVSVGGLAPVLDLLSDSSNGGALRNEGLALIRGLTATNPHIQTLVSFDGGIEKLFAIIAEEGGLLLGSAAGSLVADCLATVHNVLRNNVATQRHFREELRARHIAALLAELPSAIASTAPAAGAPPSLSPVASGGASLLPEAVSETVVAAVQVLLCLLRGADGVSEGPAMRNNLLHCGVLPPLAVAALGNANNNNSGGGSSRRFLSEVASLEALRALGLLLLRNRTACEVLIDQRVGGSGAASVSVAFACLHEALFAQRGTESAARQSAALSIVHTLLESGGAKAAGFLLRGLAPPQSSSSGGGGVARSASSLSLSGSSAAGGVAANATTLALIATSRNDNSGQLGCGALLAACIFSSAPVMSATRYHACLLLAHALELPQLQEQLLHLPWSSSSSESTLQHATFFTAYVRLTMQCMHSRQSDVATLLAQCRPILVWLQFCGRAVAAFLAEASFFAVFAEWAAQARDNIVHARLVCGVVAVLACLECPTAARASTKGGANGPPSTLPAMMQLLPTQEQLLDALSTRAPLRLLEKLLFDVRTTPEWQQAAESVVVASAAAVSGGGGGLAGGGGGAAAGERPLYDAPLKRLIEDVVRRYAQLTSSSAAAAAAGGDVPAAARGDDEVAVAASAAKDRNGSPAAAAAAPVLRTASPPVSTAPPPIESYDGAAAAAAETARMQAEAAIRAANDAAAAALRRAEAAEARARALEAELSDARQAAQRAERAAAAASEREARELEAAAAAHRDTTAALEEALEGKTDEARQLASALSMLEDRLNASVAQAAAAHDAQIRLDAAVSERDELLLLVAELDEERTMTSIANGGGVHIPLAAAAAAAGAAGAVGVGGGDNDDDATVRSLAPRRHPMDQSAISPPRTATEVDVSPSAPPLRGGGDDAL